MAIKQLNALPDGLLETSPEKLHTLLPEPTLIHLPGKHTAPLFVSVLLHGNEPAGFSAIQTVLKKYLGQTLPRSLSIFFGNTLAAAQNLRRLDDQPDYNRIWPGTELPDCEETQMAKTCVEAMRQRGAFASIDVHNNTGLNPHYACVNKLDNDFLQLARLFGRLAVYFTRPKGVQSAAFAELCPAVTLECGRPGQQHGVDHAAEFIDSCLHLSELPKHRLPSQDIDLFHTVAQVKVDERIRFSFTDANAELLLNHNLERMNFTEITAGASFGQVKDGALPVIAQDENGKDVTGEFFRLHSGVLQTTRPTMPSMLTLDERVIRQDCLCYLMERILG